MTTPKLTLCGKAASRFAGPAFGLVFAAPPRGRSVPFGRPGGH